MIAPFTGVTSNGRALYNPLSSTDYVKRSAKAETMEEVEESFGQRLASFLRVAADTAEGVER